MRIKTPLMAGFFYGRLGLCASVCTKHKRAKRGSLLKILLGWYALKVFCKRAMCCPIDVRNEGEKTNARNIFIRKLTIKNPGLNPGFLKLFVGIWRGNLTHNYFNVFVGGFYNYLAQAPKGPNIGHGHHGHGKNGQGPHKAGGVVGFGRAG